MAQVVVRQLDDEVKERLRERAARNGRSMEEEIRVILRDAVQDDGPEEGLGTQIARLFADIDEPFEIPEIRWGPVRPAVFDE